MPDPSLFPMFMNPLGGGTGAGGGEIVVEIMAEPDIVLDSDIGLSLEDDSIGIDLEEDIEIEVET